MKYLSRLLDIFKGAVYFVHNSGMLEVATLAVAATAGNSTLMTISLTLSVVVSLVPNVRALYDLELPPLAFAGFLATRRHGTTIWDALAAAALNCSIMYFNAFTVLDGYYAAYAYLAFVVAGGHYMRKLLNAIMGDGKCPECGEVHKKDDSDDDDDDDG